MLQPWWIYLLLSEVSTPHAQYSAVSRVRSWIHKHDISKNVVMSTKSRQGNSDAIITHTILFPKPYFQYMYVADVVLGFSANIGWLKVLSAVQIWNSKASTSNWCISNTGSHCTRYPWFWESCSYCRCHNRGTLLFCEGASCQWVFELCSNTSGQEN